MKLKITYITFLLIFIVCLYIALIYSTDLWRTISLSVFSSAIASCGVGIVTEISNEHRQKELKNYILSIIDTKYKICVQKFVLITLNVMINFCLVGDKKTTYCYKFEDFNKNIKYMLKAISKINDPENEKKNINKFNEIGQAYSSLFYQIEAMLDTYKIYLFDLFSKNHLEVMQTIVKEREFEKSPKYIEYDEIWKNLFELSNVLGYDNIKEFEIVFYKNNSIIYDEEHEIWETSGNFSSINQDKVIDYEFEKD